METTSDINISALLKQCKTGHHYGECNTRLYSPIFPCAQDEQYNCSLMRVLEENGYTLIEVEPDVTEGIALDEKNIFFEEGSSCLGGECLLFPSKEVRDWGCFNAKFVNDGHVDESSKIKELLERNGGINTKGFNFKNDDTTIYYIDRIDNHIGMVYPCIRDQNILDYILSTGTELKLEKEPKFKVGDVVVIDTDKEADVVGIIQEEGIQGDIGSTWMIQTTHDKEWKWGIPLVEIKRLATPEEIVKWSKETLEPNHLHYSKSKRKIIHWFLPFDKVIARYGGGGSCVWEADFISRFDEGYPVFIGGRDYAECLPYNEKTARLIGTTDDYKEE